MPYNPHAYAEDPVWLEWVAAMYESAAADVEAERAFHGHRNITNFTYYAAENYAGCAARLAESLEEATDQLLALEEDFPS